ncbi:hypothetical protein [Shewanella baltica]|uniref:hypothetical protein n=1 Tax=Shewanella baltica TaxID=62322 RepID=UPI00217DFD92|nr:hypothetical protein [Shewanella baltica]MCS6205262.1 hypothetical protein [Shewanella baltica]
MNTKPLKAYEVNEPQEGCSCIVFETNSAAARRNGAGELGIDWEDVSYCRRLPWADQYAGVKGGVPPLVCIANGWWFKCMHCSCTINSDFEGEDTEGNYIKLEPIEDGEAIYCSQSCKDKQENEEANRNLAFEAFKKSVQEQRPDLTFVDFQGAGPWITMTARFTFPGSKYRCEAREQNGSGAITWHISNGDMQAWEVYETKRSGEQA